MIKGTPCKIVSLTLSETGKHGHAKAHITGSDIFTAKKFEAMFSTAHDAAVPIVSVTDYTVIDIVDTSTSFTLKLMAVENADSKEMPLTSWTLPAEIANGDEPGSTIRNAFGKTMIESNCEVYVSVAKACHREGVISCRTIKNE